MHIEDPTLELFDDLVLLIFFDHLFDLSLGVGQYDEFNEVNCASMVFEMVVSQIHFEREQGLCPIRGGTFLDTHSVRFFVEINELRGVSCIELNGDTVKFVVKNPTKLIRECIASDEPKF